MRPVIRKMRVLFLVNLKAGRRGDAKAVETALQRFEQAKWHVITVKTRSPEEAAEHIESAVDQEFELLVVGGGDGSIHHLVQHLPLGTEENPRGLPFGIIPLGSGNDFYRGIGAPMDAWGAAENIVEGTPTPIDVGLVEPLNPDGSRRGPKPVRFTNTAGIGLDSQTLATRERAPSWLSARYELLFLMTLAWMKPVRFELEFDGSARDFDGYWILCSNSGYIGTGMHIAPQARPDDGLMDVVLVERISKIRFVYNLPRVFKGTHLGEKGVSVVKTSSLVIRGRTDLRLAVDGDRTFAPPARITMLKGAVRLMTRSIKAR